MEDAGEQEYNDKVVGHCEEGEGDGCGGDDYEEGGGYEDDGDCYGYDDECGGYDDDDCGNDDDY